METAKRFICRRCNSKYGMATANHHRLTTSERAYTNGLHRYKDRHFDYVLSLLHFILLHKQQVDSQDAKWGEAHCGVFYHYSICVRYRYFLFLVGERTTIGNLPNPPGRTQWLYV